MRADGHPDLPALTPAPAAEAAPAVTIPAAVPETTTESPDAQPEASVQEVIPPLGILALPAEAAHRRDRPARHAPPEGTAATPAETVTTSSPPEITSPAPAPESAAMAG